MDWSTVIALCAFIISIVGTVFSPIITSLIANRHQLKMRQLDIKQVNIDKYNNERFIAINNFIAKAGLCLSYVNAESVQQFGEAFHVIYQYVPDSYWPVLDEFYSSLISYNWDKAKELYPGITHYLARLLQQSSTAHP